jgi:uncharacterized membrane protein
MNHIPHELKVIGMSMMPILELRGAILYGLFSHLNPMLTFWLACFGSTIIIPLVYYLFLPAVDLLEKIPHFGSIFSKLRDRAIRKSKNLGKYEFIGLMIFVGIPLPGTGAWTGAMIASVLKMPFRYAFYAIALGNMIAGLIVLFLSHSSIKLFSSL